MITLQTDGAPVSARCPSRDRKDGLCLGFRGRWGRRRCRNRLDAVSGRRSIILISMLYQPQASSLRRSGQADMLVYQDNANVFSLGEAVEGGFDGCGLRLAVDHEEVLLSLGAGGDVLLNRCEKRTATATRIVGMEVSD